MPYNQTPSLVPKSVSNHILQIKSLRDSSISRGSNESGLFNFAWQSLTSWTPQPLRFDTEQCFSKAISDLADLNSVWQALDEDRVDSLCSVSAHSVSH